MQERTKPFRIKAKAPDGYFSLAQTAEFLKVSPKTIYRYIRERGLPASKPGGRWIIKKSELEAWVKSYE